MSSQSDNIKVCIRVRPLNSRESQEDPKSYIQTIPNQPSCLIFFDQKDNKPESKVFNFDWVAGEESTQQDIFELIGKPMVDRCLEGYNCCIFAYGQTGTGKTYTMQGRGLENNSEESLHRGLQPRIIDHIFELKDKYEAENPDVKYEIKCGYLEIYNEQVMDLLNQHSKNLTIRQDPKGGVHIEDLMDIPCSSSEETLKVLHQGAYNRHVGSTDMNQESSRSHSLFIMSIYKRTSTESFVSKFNFVDLAGSERQKKSNAKGSLLKEANSINKSLSELGHVINSLAEGKNRHISYRNSKLAYLLQDSLGGNSKTYLIANVSPASSSLSETLSTLKFAERAKLIKNKASVNLEEISMSTSMCKSMSKSLKKSQSQGTLTLPPEFDTLKQEAQVSHDPQVLSVLKREPQPQYQSQVQLQAPQICELGEKTLLKLMELMNTRQADHDDSILQAEIADLRNFKLDCQNEKKMILQEINAAAQKNKNQEDKEIQVIDLEDPAPEAEKQFFMPNEMMSQFQEMMNKIEAQAEKQVSQPKNEIEEAVRALREEYSNRITALESDLLQQRLIACDKSEEALNAEIRNKNLEKKLDMHIQSSLDQKKLWEKSLKQYENYWNQEIEQKNKEFNGLLKKNADIAFDLQIKSNCIKKLQGFKQKYMELERTSKEKNDRNEEERYQDQRKLQNYTERLSQKNQETNILKKKLHYLTHNLQQKIKDMEELERTKQAQTKDIANFQKSSVLINSMEIMISKYREIKQQKNAELTELKLAWDKLDNEHREKLDYIAELEKIKEKYEKLEESSQMAKQLQKYEDSRRDWTEDIKQKNLEIMKLKQENNQLSKDLQQKSEEFEERRKKYKKVVSKKKAYRAKNKELQAKVESLEESQKTEFLTGVSKNTLKMFGKFEEWIFSTLLLKAPFSQRHRIDTLQSLSTSFQGKMKKFITGNESSIQIPENQENFSCKEEFENVFEQFTQEFGGELQSLQQDSLLKTPSVDPSDQISIPSNEYVSESEQGPDSPVKPFSTPVLKEVDQNQDERNFDVVTLPPKLNKQRNSRPKESPLAALISFFDNKENDSRPMVSSPGIINAGRVYGSPIDPQILNGKRSYEDMRSVKTPEKKNQDQRSFGFGTFVDNLNIPSGRLSTSSGKVKVEEGSEGSLLKKKLKIN